MCLLPYLSIDLYRPLLNLLVSSCRGESRTQYESRPLLDLRVVLLQRHMVCVRHLLSKLSDLSIRLSRISMALSIARIFPPSVTPRRLTIGLAYLFGFFWVTLLLQTAIICSSDTSWHKSTNVQCTSTGQSNKAWISALSCRLHSSYMKSLVSYAGPVQLISSPT